MALTWGPVATTSAQLRRRGISAVAGMRMPDLLRRSPSDFGTCTSTRSVSIWIACFGSPGPSLGGTPGKLARYRPDGHAGGGKRGLGVGNGRFPEVEYG